MNRLGRRVRDFPGARVFRLEENYRSTAPILAAANAVVQHNEKRLGKNLWTRQAGGEPVSNSDPVTGQAGWYDVRVRIYPAGADEPRETHPQFETVGPAPGTSPARRLWQAFAAGKMVGSQRQGRSPRPRGEKP